MHFIRNYDRFFHDTAESTQTILEIIHSKQLHYNLNVSIKT